MGARLVQPVGIRSLVVVPWDRDDYLTARVWEHIQPQYPLLALFHGITVFPDSMEQVL